MNKDDLFYLGKITKIVGYKGEVAIFMDVDFPETYFSIKSVIVETKNTLVPYFFDWLQFRKDRHFKAKLIGVDTEEQSQALVNSELYLPINQLPKLEGNKFYFHEIVDFEIVDEKEDKIGLIKRVIDLPANPLFEVLNDSGVEILVPMNDNVIQKVDRDAKTIFVILPEGLLDLYLS